MDPPLGTSKQKKFNILLLDVLKAKTYLCHVDQRPLHSTS